MGKKLLIAVVLAIFFLMPIIAMAQVGEQPREITLGQYAIPVLITVFLAITFNFVNIGDRWKPLIAIGLGVILGVVAIPYHNQPWTLVAVIDHVFYGIMAGCAAVGLYEGQKAFRVTHRV